MDKSLTLKLLYAKSFAILIGISIPSLAFGRVIFAIIIGSAFFALFLFRSRQEVLSDILAQAKSPLGLAILATFVSWLPNTLVSEYPFRSLEVVLRSLLLILLSSSFYSALIKDYKLINVSLYVFTIMSCITIIFILLVTTVLPELYWLLKLQGWHPTPLTIELKGFSSVTVIIVPLLVLTAFAFSRFTRYIALILAVAFIAFVWQSYNRSALAGLLIMLVAVSLTWFSHPNKKKGKLIVFLGVMSVLVSMLIWLWDARMSVELFANMANHEDWTIPIWLIDFERQIIWKRAIDFGINSAWIGLGVNTINLLPGADEIIKGTHNLHVIPAHPHNWAVEVFAETGFLGLTALLITIITLISQNINKWQQLGNIGSVMSIAIISGYWGAGLFNFSYWSAWWQLSFYISLTICYAFVKSTRQN